jgi:ribose transport system permease protein
VSAWTARPAPWMSAVTRVQRRYTFVFALALVVVLLISSRLLATGGFGWSDQLANLAPLALAAMASTPAILSGRGGLDLSVSPLMTLSSVIFVAWLVPHGLGGASSVPIVLGAAAGVGLLNGLLIVLLRVPPVVLTLATYFALIGLSAKLLPSPEFVKTTWVSHLAGHVGPLPGAVFTLGLPLLIWIALGRIPYRRTLYAVGSNDAAAFASGVNVGAVRLAAYTLGGLYAGIGGFALTALTLSADSSQAQTYTLVAIAAVALGGTSLAGGRGGIVGPLLGAAAIYLMQDLLVTLQISTNWLQVVYGTTLVAAVVLGALVARQEPLA